MPRRSPAFIDTMLELIAARVLAAKARCPGFDFRHHFLSSPMLLQRSTDSNNVDCVLF